jgi:hypothetical protein
VSKHWRERRAHFEALNCWEERRLWCEVIERAWHDYLTVSPIDPTDRIEAALFLTEEIGEWATSRNNVCIAADFDPDLLRERALKASAAL